MNILSINKKGFTLIETLVAITILMIAIAGPLVIANKGLTSALYARDQSIASNLAQESMEVIKNIKDNNVNHNLINPNPVVDFLSGLKVGCTANNGSCDADADNVENHCTTIDGCPMYINADGDYNNGGEGSRSIFSRYYYLTKMDDNDYIATVIVRWNEGVTPNEVKLNSEITNSIRQ